MQERSLFDGAEGGGSAIDETAIFFALRPPAEVASRFGQVFERLRAEAGIGAAPIPFDRLHTTLFTVAPQERLSRDRVAAAHDAGSALEAARFEVEFDHVLTFRNGQVKPPIVLVGGDGLAAWRGFQERLGLAALKAGAIRSRPQYTPHLTLAYDGQPVDRIDIEPIRWTVAAFELVRSHVGEGRHETMARWALPDGANSR